MWLVDRGESAELQRRLTGAGSAPDWSLGGYEAHRVAGGAPHGLASTTDERTIPHEVGWIGRPRARRRPPGQGLLSRSGKPLPGCINLGKTAAQCWPLFAPRRVRWTGRSTGDAVLAGGERASPAVSEPWSTTSIWARWPWRLLKRGIPADTALKHRAVGEVAAMLDPASLPAGRRARRPGSGSRRAVAGGTAR